MLLAIAVTVAVVVLAAVVAGLPKAAAVQGAAIELKDAKVVRLGTTGALLNVTVNVTNPNAFGAVLDRADFVLYVNDHLVGQCRMTQGLDIPAGGSVEATVPVTVTYAAAAVLTASHLTADNVDWRVDGTARIDTATGRMDVPFQSNGTWAGSAV